MIWMERLLTVRPVVLAGVVLCAAMALVLLFFTPFAVLLLAGAGGAWGALRYGIHRQLQAIGSRQQADEIRRGLKRLAREQVPAAN